MKNIITGIIIGIAISAQVGFAIQHRLKAIPTVVSVKLENNENYVGLYNASGDWQRGYTVAYASHVIINETASGGVYIGNAILNLKKQ